jgi:hypothetical protein
MNVFDCKKRIQIPARTEDIVIVKEVCSLREVLTGRSEIG